MGLGATASSRLASIQWHRPSDSRRQIEATLGVGGEREASGGIGRRIEGRGVGPEAEEPSRTSLQVSLGDSQLGKIRQSLVNPSQIAGRGRGGPLNWPGFWGGEERG